MDFQAWPKTPRLFRDIVITEKIDGTNAAINIQKYDTKNPPEDDDCKSFAHVYGEGDEMYCVGAQSRNRLIFPAGWDGNNDSDNAGFARWVDENAQRLYDMLGPGRHYGEWWGQSIGRKYDMEYKQFSLFNTAKWGQIVGGLDEPFGVSVQLGDGRIGSVPVLYQGPFDQGQIESALWRLRKDGSQAALGYLNPEGICVYHTQSKQVYKVTLDGNDRGKWESGE